LPNFDVDLEVGECAHGRRDQHDGGGEHDDERRLVLDSLEQWRQRSVRRFAEQDLVEDDFERPRPQQVGEGDTNGAERGDGHEPPGAAQLVPHDATER
jgi:hypothetical protein